MAETEQVHPPKGRREDRIEELARIVTCERDAQPPELVVRAEREILDRLGGTREDVRRRARRRYAWFLAAGVLLLATAAGCYFLGQASVQFDVDDRMILTALACLAGLAGIPFTLAPLSGLLRRPTPVIRVLVSPQSRYAMDCDPPHEDLLAAVGAERASRTPDEAKKDDIELFDRLITSRQRAMRSLEIGASLILAAFVFIVLPAAAVVASYASWDDMAEALALDGPRGGASDFIVLVDSAMLLGRALLGVTAVASAGAGLAGLAAVGLLLRWERARKLMLVAPWLAAVGAVCMLPTSHAAINPQTSDPALPLAFLGLNALVVLCFGLFGVCVRSWLSSVGVRELFGRATASLADEPPRAARASRRRTVALVVCALAALVAVSTWQWRAVHRRRLMLSALAAARRGRVEELRSIIRREPDAVHAADGFRSVLAAAAEAGSPAAVRLLLDAGADPNGRCEDEGETPLFFASDPEVAELLIARGADVGAVAERDRTPLHVAARQGRLNVVGVLLDHGADPSAGAGHIRTPLHAAVHGGRVDVMAALMARGADVNAVDGRGRTPLHHATSSYGIEPLDYLLAHGADVNAADSDGMTPLHCATDEGNEESVAALLKAGAKVDAVDDDQWTPLHYAAIQDDVACARAFLKAGADVNAVDGDGSTPLHLLGYGAGLAFVKLLVEHGANVNAVDNSGRTVLRRLRDEYGRSDVVDYLRKQGAKEEAPPKTTD